MFFVYLFCYTEIIEHHLIKIKIVKTESRVNYNVLWRTEVVAGKLMAEEAVDLGRQREHGWRGQKAENAEPLTVCPHVKCELV